MSVTAESFDSASNSGKSDYDEQECADVKMWLARISDAREFDKAQRKQYAKDRRYARGDAGDFEVSIPIAGTYIDILKSFLYARNPDLDILPADSTNPPPMADIMEMARAQVMANPQTQQTMLQVGMLAAQQAVQASQQASIEGPQAVLGVLPKTTAPPPINPQAIGQQASEAWLQQTVREAAKQILAPYHTRQEQAKQLGATLEIVIENLWKKARLKLQADPAVGSCLTIGLGWLKASWQERTGDDPIIRNQLDDMQDNLARIVAQKKELTENDPGTDLDELKAQIEQEMEGLKAKVEVIVARGLAIDYVSGEDMQVAPAAQSMMAYVDSPWIAHRTFMGMEDAKAAFADLKPDDLKKASVYYQQKPADPAAHRDVGQIASVDAVDADTYRTGEAPSTSQGASEKGSVCVWEVWNKDADMVLTLIEGMDVYAKEPFAPDPGTTRFYPFFQIAMLKIDGERHPQSMITRTRGLLDDMNRLYSNRATHRRRAIPKTAFDATNLSERDAKRLESGGIGEMVGIKPTVPGSAVANMLHNVTYPVIDGALYDDRPTRAMLEMTWGIQEALASSIQTAKTATEAEIQQTGTNARTSYMRDAIDGVMDDLALYSAEVALQKMSHEDVVQIAGPWAFWPEGMKIEQLGILVSVSVKGGSSGKPDTTAQQQAWATTMPILQSAVIQVGQLRQSSPADIADCIQELVTETLNRTGDRLDPSRFLPPAPTDQAGQQPPPPQMPPQPAAAPGPTLPMPPPQGGSNLVPVPHNGNVNGHRV